MSSLSPGYMQDYCFPHPSSLIRRASLLKSDMYNLTQIRRHEVFEKLWSTIIKPQSKQMLKMGTMETRPCINTKQILIWKFKLQIQLNYNTISLDSDMEIGITWNKTQNNLRSHCKTQCVLPQETKHNVTRNKTQCLLPLRCHIVRWTKKLQHLHPNERLCQQPTIITSI